MTGSWVCVQYHLCNDHTAHHDGPLWPLLAEWRESSKAPGGQEEAAEVKDTAEGGEGEEEQSEVALAGR